VRAFQAIFTRPGPIDDADEALGPRLHEPLSKRAVLTKVKKEARNLSIVARTLDAVAV